jgi:hypothetical protein
LAPVKKSLMTVGCHSWASRLSSLLASSAAGHLGDLTLVLQMVIVVLVKFLFVDHGLLVEEALGEGVVFALDPFSLSLAHDQV